MVKRAKLSSAASFADLKASKPAPAKEPEPKAEAAEAKRGRGRPPKRNAKPIGLTLRLDEDTYRTLQALTIEQKFERDNRALATHDLLLEAVDLLLVKYRKPATAVQGKRDAAENG